MQQSSTISDYQVNDSGWTQARNAWPTVDVSRVRFDAFVAERQEACANDLDLNECYLVQGCLEGQSSAMRSFEEVYFPAIARVVQSLGGTQDIAEDVKQQIWEYLFTNLEEARPRIASYAGFGTLHGLIRTIAWRSGRRLVARAQRDQSLEHLNGSAASAECLDFVDDRFRDSFRTALSTSWKLLDERELVLLQLHYLEGLSHDQIAQTYSVHRTTVVRWIADARRRLAAHVKTHLRQDMGAMEETVDSMVRGFCDNVEVSMRVVLGLR